MACRGNVSACYVPRTRRDSTFARLARSLARSPAPLPSPPPLRGERRGRPVVPAFHRDANYPKTLSKESLSALAPGFTALSSPSFPSPLRRSSIVASCRRKRTVEDLRKTFPGEGFAYSNAIFGYSLAYYPRRSKMEGGKKEAYNNNNNNTHVTDNNYDP